MTDLPTNVPGSEAPAGEAPASEAPAGEAPASEAPASEAPPASRPVGDPAPYGLLIFATGGTVLGISLLGYVSPTAQGGSVQPIVYAATGLGVLVCTIWAAALGQTFPAAIYGAFTGFWLSYTALVLGLAHNWYGIPPADIPHTEVQFLITWAVVIFMLLLVSLRIPLAFTAIFASALAAAILLIVGTLNGSVALDPPAGGFVLLFSAIGFYAYLSTGLESVGGKALPLGPPVASMFSKGPHR